MRKSENGDALLRNLRALDPEHPLRQQAMSVLDGPQMLIQDIAPVLEAIQRLPALGSQEFEVACWLIGHAEWSAAQSATLSAKLSGLLNELLEARKPGRFAGRSMGYCLFWVSVPLLTNMLTSLLPEKIFNITILPGLLFLLSLPVGAALVWSISSWDGRHKRKQRKAIMEALAQVGQSAALLPLATATLEYSLHDETVPVLLRVLERVQARDFGTLPAQTIPTLCKTLPLLPPHQVLIVLKALALIGDAHAIDPVQRLSREARDSEIKREAAQLLPLLQQRARDIQASALLLRASDAPAESGATLLRVPHNPPTTDPTQLLRVANSGNLTQESSEQPKND